MVRTIHVDILARDRGSRARVGQVTTPHGVFETPAFMPVGTKGTVKGILPQQVAQIGAEIVLANTYHLMLRPGSELVAGQGGLHRFMGWGGPILTDSGGFQVFSLAHISRIDDDGVDFKSHIDGSAQRMDAERSMKVQNELGADIIMAFDDCPPPEDKLTEGAKRNQAAAERTARWLERCIKAHGRADEQGLFGIVQGGTDLELRSKCVEQVCNFDLAGYAIGGVAVGEPPEEMSRVVNHTAGLLPEDKPRYLMGVVYERDIVSAVRAGVDMFDCVLPTRNGRNANAFTVGGPIRLRNAEYAQDAGPIDATCDCAACVGFGRAYLRHLFMSDEMLGPILVSLHNLRHFQRLMLDIRRAIREDAWPLLERNWPVLGETSGTAA